MSNHNIISIDNLSLQELDTDAELIPLLTPEDEEEMSKEELPDSYLYYPLETLFYFQELSFQFPQEGINLLN